jgi:uncharacterized membrane protein
MKNMKNTGSLFVMTALTVIFFTGSARSADFGTETQALITKTITQAIDANINRVASGDSTDQTMIKKIQSSMMTKISDTVKQNTAARKRAAVIETCMECRAMQPIKIIVSGKSTFFDADIQERINQAMAKRIEETIRVISSDPAVARIVQDRMMVPRMAASPLRQEMQSFMMSKLLSVPSTMNVADNKTENTNSPLAKAKCTTTDSRFPNC